ncbi:alkaline phosphatase D family protein [Kribbella sp. ALI-6-A]|uniref:alkaline phosphatase D family protein n=1 Tax=Kribbella sp. ALI-6-A TaxID=1933817 RepID=UPI001179D665|nr:alkaline phosphatase D family protein [Kribbella sp. ALI-6-A]
MQDPSVTPATPWTPSRRRLLWSGALGAAALGTLSPGPASAGTSRAGTTGHGPVRGPFTLGVASGDPLPDRVVLWTRLAPEPLAEDGSGGMPNRPVPVHWEISEDETFRRIVARGMELARPEEAHSVHVDASGLQPRTTYFYRFRTGAELSPVGRTKTAPRPTDRLDRFSFAFASCQNYPAGFYTAYRHLAAEDLDLVAFLGDYLYTGDGQGTIGRGYVPVREVQTLPDYRVRLAQVKSDADLQAAHAAFPWLMTFDDHEVANNWAGTDVDPNVPVDEFLARRAAGFQAYYEHMPVRRAQRPSGADIQFYRRLTFGDLVDFYLLDTRQYRSDQVGPARRYEPGRTMLGDVQEKWLTDALAGPTARWNVLAQQVVFSQRDFTVGPEQGFNDDSWDNYPIARDRLRDQLARAGNPVVLTGDVHMNYVSDITADFDDPTAAVVGTELVGTSISSGGDSDPNAAGDARQLAENPHLKFINRERGYVRNVVTPAGWTADFRTVDYVSRPGAPVRTRASFRIDDGRPGARRV